MLGMTKERLKELRRTYNDGGLSFDEEAELMDEIEACWAERCPCRGCSCCTDPGYHARQEGFPTATWTEEEMRGHDRAYHAFHDCPGSPTDPNKEGERC